MMGLKALDMFPVLDEAEPFWIDEVEHAVLMHITEGLLRGYDWYAVAGTRNGHRRRCGGRHCNRQLFRDLRKSDRLYLRKLNVFLARFEAAADPEAGTVNKIRNRTLMKPLQVVGSE